MVHQIYGYIYGSSKPILEILLSIESHSICECHSQSLINYNQPQEIALVTKLFANYLVKTTSH